MEKPSIYNTKDTPLLIKIISYYIIVKSGVKIVLSLLFVLSGGHIESLKKVIGFDTLNGGGLALQFFLIAAAALHIYGAFQLLQFKRLGFFIHVAMVLVFFFVPAFLSPETYQYTPSRIGFMLPQLVVPLMYFSRMK